MIHFNLFNFKVGKNVANRICSPVLIASKTHISKKLKDLFLILIRVFELTFLLKNNSTKDIFFF